MSNSAQYRQFRLSYHALYGRELSPDEIAAFHARHNPPSNSRDRTPVPLSFQTAGPP